jgi:hypothetical protein
MPKNVEETEGPQMTSQYGAYALHAGLARLHARRRIHTPTRPGTPHARTHAQACTHGPIYNTYCFSTVIMVSWTHLSVTSYVYCMSSSSYVLRQYFVLNPISPKRATCPANSHWHWFDHSNVNSLLKGRCKPKLKSRDKFQYRRKDIDSFTDL